MALQFAIHPDTLEWHGWNATGQAGIPIPVLEGVHFINPQVVYEEGAVRVETDIQYQPSSLLQAVGFDDAQDPIAKGKN